MKKLMLIALIFLAIITKISGQNFSQFENLFEPEAKNKYSFFDKNNDSEIKILLEAFYGAYKNFVSDQDSQTCVFYPSCSTYGLHAIEHKGLIIGTLATFDRLTRCNGFSPQKYQKYKDTNFFHDPIIEK